MLMKSKSWWNKPLQATHSLSLDQQSLFDNNNKYYKQTGIPKSRNSYNYFVVQSYHTTPRLMIIHHSYIKTSVSDL